MEYHLNFHNSHNIEIQIAVLDKVDRLAGILTLQGGSTK